MSKVLSVLYDVPGETELPLDQPEHFVDLNLGQVETHLFEDFAEYDLASFFRAPLSSPDAITYRHEVFHDLDRQATRSGISRFSFAMQTVRQDLTQGGKLRHPLQRQRWHLDAAIAYTDAVTQLRDVLNDSQVASRALRDLASHLARYVSSGHFRNLRDQANRTLEGLASVTYCLRVAGDRVRVSRYADEEDYTAAVSATFERFRHGAAKDYRIRFSNWPEMNHVEEQILERVARLYPTEFGSLQTFHDAHPDFLDPTITRFDREIHFYLAFQRLRDELAEAGLRTCYPRLSTRSKRTVARETFDLALALKCTKARQPVVTNDIELANRERIIVVSGPNQGGKTTLARTFGQLHYLARLGVPVPGRQAQLLICDEVFTHFEREESHADLSGKLEDDLLRIHDILGRATSRSVVVMNEIFTSTTLQDAIVLGQAILAEIVRLDLVCVYVTFVDELTTVSDTTVSMVSTVSPTDPTRRTFKVERRPADGIAHALALATRYDLDYATLRDRIAS